jgi:hypothetical protein
MPTIKDSNYGEMKDLFGQIEANARSAGSLQAAAQACAEQIYRHYSDSLVLFRIYATLPYADLPPEIDSFVRGITDAHAMTPMLQPSSIMLTLLGTAGVQPEWNDRLQSRGHLGIPLMSASFVANLPMVAALMKDMGIDLEWLDRQDSSFVVKAVGRIARVFFVSDARTVTDDQGRKVVPAADFVEAHGVRTVFGLGGAYLDGTFLAMILFTRETLEKRQAEAFQPLLNYFKMGTMGAVMEHRIFT